MALETQPRSGLPRAAWIDELAAEGITSGCGNGKFCPDSAINRAATAALILRAVHPSGFHPPPATGTVFRDIPLGTFLADWIEELADEGITHGCGGGNYYPNQAVTRGEMAKFLANALDLQIP